MGNPTEDETVKPAFCSACGAPLGPDAACSTCAGRAGQPPPARKIAAAHYRHPSGLVRYYRPADSFAGALLLGPLYFAAIGAWGHAFVELVLALVLGASGASIVGAPLLVVLWVGYALCASHIRHERLLLQGFVYLPRQSQVLRIEWAIPAAHSVMRWGKRLLAWLDQRLAALPLLRRLSATDRRMWMLLAVFVVLGGIIAAATNAPKLAAFANVNRPVKCPDGSVWYNGNSCPPPRDTLLAQAAVPTSTPEYSGGSSPMPSAATPPEPTTTVSKHMNPPEKRPIASPTAVPVAAPAAEPLSPPLEVQSWRCVKGEYGYDYAEGEVKNVSAMRIENLVAVNTFRTADGTFVTSDDALVKYRPLMPGQTTPFKVASSANPMAKRCELSFMLLGGAQVPSAERKAPAKASKHPTTGATRRR